MLVRRPRAGDATGASLRKAYDGGQGITPDLLRLMRALDKID